MSLKLSINPSQVRKRLAIFVAIFALLVQPMYALVASQVANATTATVTNQTDLEDALKPDSGKTTIELGGDFIISSQVSISRTLTLNGNNATLTAASGWSGSASNDSVLAVTGGNPTIRNLTIEGAAASDVQGLQVWQSAATLENITSKNNQKAGIHVNKSTVHATNITTHNNSRGKSTFGVANFGGILVSAGGSLSIGGISTHTSENNQIRRDSGTVTDREEQYRASNILVATRYTLKSAPAAPAITAPADGSTVTSSAVNATWTAPSTSSSRNAAASYNVSIDGGPATRVATTNHTFTGLANGSYTISVQSVAASGLLGGTATQTFTVAIPDTTPPTFAITNPVNGSYVRGTQTINAQITDESDIAKVLINIAGDSRSWTNGASATITRTGDIFSTTIDTKKIADGPVYVSLRGTDGVGNTRYWNNNASNRQHVFYVDNTRPVVELVSPVGASYNPVNYEVKATDNLALQTVTAHIYNATNTTLVKNCSSTVTPDGADEYNLVCPVSSLGLANGTYTIRYNATDKAGNIATTETATFTIDTTKPTIHVKGQGNTYTPTSLGQGNIFREVSFKLFDSGKIDRVEINGVNKNLSDSTWSDVDNVKPGKFGAVEGKNTLVVFDVAGNSTTYEFVLDTTAPKITVKPGYVGDLDNKIFSNVSFKLQDSVLADKYVLNGHTVDFTNNKNSDANFQNIKSKLVQGENTIVLYDVAGNSGSYIFTYDSVAPTAPVITSPAQNQEFSGERQTIRATWDTATDENGIAQYQIEYVYTRNGAQVTEYREVAGDRLYRNQGISGNIHSDFTIRVRALDNAGNWGAWSDPVTYYVGVPAPGDDEDETETPGNGDGGDTSGQQNQGQGGLGGAEVPVIGNTDEDDAPALRSNPIAFLPATFGTTGFNDGTATTPLLRTAPSANSDDSDADVLGAEDVRADWSVVNAALAGFIAILAVVALAGIRRKETDNNTGARVFMLVPAAAAIIAFFVIDDLTGSMIWFNVWTWLFAGILVVQAILATLTTKTAND